MRIEPTAKRVRAFVGGVPVADSTSVALVWDERPYPAYWFPEADVRTDLVEARAGSGELAGLVHVPWQAAEAWFEEDEEVFTHPRDPHKRVDILPTSRRVTVAIDGVVLADSERSAVLFETGLPPRWYLPKTDVRMDLLVPTETSTSCPDKGTARYWSARVGDRLVEDVAWSYPAPLPESLRIAGLVAFYNDRVDLQVT
jgi:uncharacterized protein (DUF427 family)